MYLIDTNIWLERLLNQERSEEVGRLFNEISSENFYITDFSFHSIGIILCKLSKRETFRNFIQDIFIEGAVNIIHLEPGDTDALINAWERFNLDFDDAYQYCSAKKYNLYLVSFDKDFDKTDIIIELSR
jgi:predicted nucleic acid-binding protein